MIARMDREIGRVLEQIRAMDAWEDTLVLFLSDNGTDATMMVRGDGTTATPNRDRGSRSFAWGRVGPRSATRRSGGTRSGCMKAASPRR
jgi:arylsulfatase A-like enzyme